VRIFFSFIQFCKEIYFSHGIRLKTRCYVDASGKLERSRSCLFFLTRWTPLDWFFRINFLWRKRWWNKKYRFHIIFCTGSWFRKPGPGFGRTKIVIFFYFISLESIKNDFFEIFLFKKKCVKGLPRWFLFSLIGTHWLGISIP